MNWTHVNSDLGYVLEASTGSYPNSFSGNQSSVTTNGTAGTLTVVSLGVNTTYYLRVGSRWADGTTSYVTALATSTLAQQPTANAITAVFVTSMTYAWNSLNDPQNTSFNAVVSTTSDFDPAYATNTLSSAASVPQFTFVSLSTNTTHYFRVRAINHNAVETGWTSTILSTSSLAAVVGSPSVQSVNFSSVTLAWTPVSAGEAESYLMEVSTDSAFNPVEKSSATTDIAVSQLTVTGLKNATTYYFRVGSLNHSNVASFTTSMTTMTTGWGKYWASTDELGDQINSLEAGDFNGDGYLDFAAVNGWFSLPSRIYRNKGDGTFTLEWSATDEQNDNTSGGAWGDIDNDGDLDLMIGGLGGYPNRVYRNDGGGTFTLTWSGTSESGDVTYDAAWGDYDNDGDVDLLTASLGTNPDRIYGNLGGGSFALVWSGSAYAVDGTRDVDWGDFDRDGDLDFATANGNTGSPQRVFRNDGVSGFTVVWSASAESADQSASVEWGDYDIDGDIDLLFGMNSLSYPNRIYKNDGGGTFVLAWSATDETADVTQSARWADFDNDGDLDFATANSEATLPNRVYRNEGGDSFTVFWAATGG